MPRPALVDVDEIGAAVLAAARERGWSSWSVRAVADVLGVTGPALYRHVADRDELALLAGAAGARLLLDAVGRSADVLAASRAYVAFAAADPAAYAAFVGAKPPPEHPHAGAWVAAWHWLEGLVAAEVPEAPGACAFALWSLLHGRVALTGGPTPRVDADAGLAVDVAALLDGYRRAGQVPSPVPPTPGG